jgi:hypothetical protein
MLRSSSNGRGRGRCRAERNRCFIRRWPLARTALLVTRVRSLCSGLLVTSSRRSIRSRTCSATPSKWSRHVLPSPHDLGPPTPPLERLPGCILALPVARAPPCADPSPRRTLMLFRTLCAASARASRSVSCAHAGSAVQMRAACFSSSGATCENTYLYAPIYLHIFWKNLHTVTRLQASRHCETSPYCLV